MLLRPAPPRRRIRLSPGRRPSPGRQQGFTLLEVLAVLVILGLIAVLVAPQVFGRIGRARADSAKVLMQSVATALDTYRLDTGGYPSERQGLKALLENPGREVQGWGGPYLRRADQIQDPWGNPWVYGVPGDNGAPYELKSFGADGKEGGEGEDADLSLQQL